MKYQSKRIAVFNLIGIFFRQIFPVLNGCLKKCKTYSQTILKNSALE